MQIVNVDIPKILLQYGKDWNYYIIGGRAYNIIMKIPVATLDYDIKINEKIEDVLLIRDFVIHLLEEKYPQLNIVSYDGPTLARIIISDYDIVDFSPISDEHITPIYDIRKDYIIGPNNLRYGGLKYLYRRLEELTKIRKEERDVIEMTKESYLLTKSNLNLLFNYLYDYPYIDPKLINEFQNYVNEFGKSSESDNLISSGIKDDINQITSLLIENNNLDSSNQYNSFVNSDDKRAWLNKRRPKGLNYDNPLDIVMLLFLAEEIYGSSSVLNNNLAEKTDKYNRTLARLEALKLGLLYPYDHYSEFFIEYLNKRCKKGEKIETFINKNFNCLLIKS